MSQNKIDPRGPRFGATITSVLMLVVIYFALDTTNYSIAVWLVAIVTGLFAIGATLGTAKHPYGLIFKRLVRPLLPAPAELEDARPPKFAQVIGLIISSAGLIFGLLGQDFQVGLIVAAIGIFLAAFLNSAFNYCVGCQIWLALARSGVIKA
ncbi:MAG: hypothetical protein RLZZ606_483 [Actinomycetota bacterium]|jgi:hypothetical protein